MLAQQASENRLTTLKTNSWSYVAGDETALAVAYREDVVDRGRTRDVHVVREKSAVSAFMIVEFRMAKGHTDTDADPLVVATSDISKSKMKRVVTSAQTAPS